MLFSIKYSNEQGLGLSTSNMEVTWIVKPLWPDTLPKFLCLNVTAIGSATQC